MSNTSHHLITRITLRAACAALGLMVVVGLAIVVSPSAKAQVQNRHLSTLLAFSGTDGSRPEAGVVMDKAGNLYGTTFVGGAGDGAGVVFRLDANNVETVLHNFCVTAGCPDGAGPEASLILDSQGNLYGTTFAGGSANCFEGCGVVFKVDTTGAETVLYSFPGGADGAGPAGSLIFDSQGILYGTTSNGGSTNSNCTIGCGVVFKLDTTGAETVLYTFTGGADGGVPTGGLLRDGRGNLYGTASLGGNLTCGNGSRGCGVVYQLNSAGKMRILHTFTGGSDGSNPLAGIIGSAGGKIYGTASTGGTGACNTTNPGCGIVFRLNKSGAETILYTFTGGADGEYPAAGLVQDTKGNLYGAAAYDGSLGYGTVFKLVATTGKLIVLHTFKGTDGENPTGTPILDGGGNLYGTTLTGNGSQGTVFKMTP